MLVGERHLCIIFMHLIFKICDSVHILHRTKSIGSIEFDHEFAAIDKLAASFRDQVPHRIVVKDVDTSYLVPPMTINVHHCITYPENLLLGALHPTHGTIECLSIRNDTSREMSMDTTIDDAHDGMDSCIPVFVYGNIAE